MSTSSISLKDALTETLTQKSGHDVVYIDLHNKSSMADGMIVATGTSNTHLNTLADYAARTLKEHGGTVLSETGRRQGEWVLIDSPEIIIHLFKEEARALYQLEKMWSVDFKNASTSDMQQLA